MENLSSNLLFELMGYSPKTIFTIQVLNTKYCNLLEHRTDALATLMRKSIIIKTNEMSLFLK